METLTLRLKTKFTYLKCIVAGRGVCSAKEEEKVYVAEKVQNKIVDMTSGMVSDYQIK